MTWKNLLWGALALALAWPASAQYQQTGKLTAASGYDSGSYFGRSAAIEGSRLVVGAPGKGDGIGRAHLFDFGVDGWVETGELHARDEAPGDDFGRSIAISHPYVLVGAPLRQDGNGAAYVFELRPGGPMQVAKLERGSYLYGADFGRSVALKGDVALVGAPGENRVYVFRRSGLTWSLWQVLQPPFASEYGTSLVFDGVQAAVGAPRSKEVYVHVTDGVNWAPAARITPPSWVDDVRRFGQSLALAGDLLAIGAPDDDRDGKAFLYRGAGATWDRVVHFGGNGLLNENEFGAAVAVANERLVVGAPGQRTREGVVRIYACVDGTWQQTETLLPDVTQSNFGTFGLALAANKDFLLVNLGLDDAPVFGRYSGAMNVFTQPTDTGTLTADDNQ